MSPSSLAHKMKLKPGQRAAVANPPDGFLNELGPLPARVQVAGKLHGQFEWLQVFVKNKAELDKLVPRLVRALKPESLLWISFPKGTSKIQTDLTRDRGWDAVQKVDLKGN